MKGYEEIGDPARADTEITLGPRSILGVFFALTLICGVFFGLGYALGHSNAAKSKAAALARKQTTPPQSATPLQTVVESAGTSTTAGNSGSSTTTAQSANASSPVKPSATTAALPAPVAQPAAYDPSPATNVVPEPRATTYVTPKLASRSREFMVQIAAVSRRHDAEVLVAALRRHGYTPVVRQGTHDSLLHVQVGPFATRRAAREMRAKLLRSGYNAIVK